LISLHGQAADIALNLFFEMLIIFEGLLKNNEIKFRVQQYLAEFQGNHVKK